jgi:dTDP-4-amino-4,6-dideoxygalactose transaminase
MKQKLNELAFFGGAPTFDMALHVGRPNIGDRSKLLERFNNILDNRWLTNNGPYVQEFERQIADYLGVKHCIAICNATVALEIAIRALDLSGEVIIPSMTFIATAHALYWQQITPVFCDIDPETFTLDPTQVEALITPRTTGILGVHLWGRGCKVDALTEIAKRRGLKLLYDAAHSFACSHNGQLIGKFGDAEVFSFHATKFFNSFEGGAVVTNDDGLAARIRLMKNFGFAGHDDVVHIGTNGKMSEISAAMGLTNLESLDEFVAINHANYRQYEQELAIVPGIRLLKYNEAERCNYQYIVLDIEADVTGLTRDQLHAILWAENILARRYFYPGCHRMEPYHSLFPSAGILLPVTEKYVLRLLTLPTGTGVSANDIHEICEIIKFALTQPEAITAALLEHIRLPVAVPAA